MEGKKQKATDDATTPADATRDDGLLIINQPSRMLIINFSFSLLTLCTNIFLIVAHQADKRRQRDKKERENV
jgi:hypothetical protein